MNFLVKLAFGFPRRSPTLPPSAVVCRYKSQFYICAPFSSSSSSSNNQRHRNTQQDPYRVLGIPHGSPCEKAKEAFLRLAMRCHPDLVPGRPSNEHKASESLKKNSATDFIRIRKAFEQIRNHAKIFTIEWKDNAEEASDWTDQQWRSYVQSQFHFVLEQDTRQEIVDTVDRLQPTGLDAGGTWFMAKMLHAQHYSQQQQQQHDQSKNNGGGSRHVPANIGHNSKRVRRRKRT